MAIVVIGQAQGVITHTSSTGEICSRWPSLAPAARALEVDDAAARAHPAPRHVLAEGRHRQRGAIFGSAT